MMELYINKIAHYLPENTVPNSYFKEVNGLDDEWIYSRTGIKNRTKAGENENTNTMGIKAVDLATKDLQCCPCTQAHHMRHSKDIR